MLADHGHLANDLLSPPTLADIAWIEADPGDARREPADGWRVRTAIVVQDDDGLAAGVPKVVEGLVRHAPGEGAVADYGHNLAAPAGVGAVCLAGLPGGVSAPSVAPTGPKFSRGWNAAEPLITVRANAPVND